MFISLSLHSITFLLITLLDAHKLKILIVAVLQEELMFVAAGYKISAAQWFHNVLDSIHQGTGKLHSTPCRFIDHSGVKCSLAVSQNVNLHWLNSDFCFYIDHPKIEQRQCQGWGFFKSLFSRSRFSSNIEIF